MNKNVKIELTTGRPRTVTDAVARDSRAMEARRFNWMPAVRSPEQTPPAPTTQDDSLTGIDIDKIVQDIVNGIFQNTDAVPCAEANPGDCAENVPASSTPCYTNPWVVSTGWPDSADFLTIIGAPTVYQGTSGDTAMIYTPWSVASGTNASITARIQITNPGAPTYGYPTVTLGWTNGDPSSASLNRSIEFAVRKSAGGTGKIAAGTYYLQIPTLNQAFLSNDNSAHAVPNTIGTDGSFYDFWVKMYYESGTLYFKYWLNADPEPSSPQKNSSFGSLPSHLYLSMTGAFGGSNGTVDIKTFTTGCDTEVLASTDYSGCSGTITVTAQWDDGSGGYVLPTPVLYIVEVMFGAMVAREGEHYTFDGEVITLVGDWFDDPPEVTVKYVIA